MWCRECGLRVDIAEVSRVVVEEYDHLGSKLVLDQRAFDRGGDVELFFVSRTNTYAGTELAIGTSIAQYDSAARHVASEQQSLRTTQHFDRFEIKGIDDNTVGRTHENAVNKYADRRIDRRDRAVDALAANREVLYARERADRLELHVRHDVTQILDFLYEQRIDLLGTESRYGDRHVLDRLGIALLPRYRDDFLEKRSGRPFLGLGVRRIWLRKRNNGDGKTCPDRHGVSQAIDS